MTILEPVTTARVIRELLAPIPHLRAQEQHHWLLWWKFTVEGRPDALATAARLLKRQRDEEWTAEQW